MEDAVPAAEPVSDFVSPVAEADVADDTTDVQAETTEEADQETGDVGATDDSAASPVTDNDIVFGGSGDDLIFGESGDDLIFGGDSPLDEATLIDFIRGHLGA